MVIIYQEEKKNKNQIDESVRQKVVYAYLNTDKQLIDIANDFNISPSSIYNILTENNIQRYRRSSNKINNKECNATNELKGWEKEMVAKERENTDAMKPYDDVFNKRIEGMYQSINNDTLSSIIQKYINIDIDDDKFNLLCEELRPFDNRKDVRKDRQKISVQTVNGILKPIGLYVNHDTIKGIYTIVEKYKTKVNAIDVLDSMKTISEFYNFISDNKYIIPLLYDMSTLGVRDREILINSIEVMIRGFKNK